METGGITRLAAERLSELADPEAARQMAAYMKTDMPFYGVKKPDRVPVLRRLAAEFPPANASDYRRKVGALWERPHREEKYLAIGYARRFGDHIDLPQLGLYRRMVVEGAWWDLVDEVAAHLVGKLVAEHRRQMRPVLEGWIDDDDLWLRRTAILCQLRHKEATDAAILFDFCRRRAHEKEFFIRKAIGWALREYARTDPEAVRQFVEDAGGELSGLSRREATRHL
ncbi:MAG: DNA alkylation repair protein [Actinomycetota bacterium]